MKKLLLIASVLIVVFTTGASKSYEKPRNVVNVRDSCASWTIYEVAEYATGAPREVIEGFHWAESSKGQNIHHKDPNDQGEFGINRRWQAERYRKHGTFDPFNAHDAAIEAGRIYMDNLKALGSQDAAISAYNTGITGTQRNGIRIAYVRLVTAGMPKGAA